MKTIASLLAVAGLSVAASADITLKLKSDQDLFSLCSDNTSPFWIGNNPSACALVGDDLYIAGYSFAGTSAYIVKIEQIYGVRAFRQIPGSLTTLPGNRGFTGMAFSTRNSGTDGNLLVSYDSGSSSAGSVRLFDVTTQLNPILRTNSTGIRGSAGAAWDPGFNAAGFSVGANFYPEIPSAMIFGLGGPLGLAPATLDGNVGATVYEPGLGGPTTGTGMGGTLWRDLDVSNDGQYIVGRAGNQMSIFRRTTGNDVGTITIVGTYNAAFVNGHNCEIVEVTGEAPVIAYNDRPVGTVGQQFANVVKFVNVDGTPANVALTQSDGTTVFTAPDSNGYYEFSWDQTNQRLALLDLDRKSVV